MPLTFAEAKLSRLNRISGVCSGSPEFADYLNEGTRQLMKRGNWWNTVVKTRICIYSGCITLPRYIETPLSTNICGEVTPIHNHWYQFTGLDRQDWNPNRTWPSTVAWEQDGTTPVFNNIPCGKAMTISIFPRRQADLGKTITFFGIDQNGQTVRTTWPDGTFQEGEVVSLVINAGITDCSTVTRFSQVTRVLKDATEGEVDVYAYDVVNNVLLEMAHYQPSETNPEYVHLRLHGYNAAQCSSCCPLSVKLISQLRFIPVSNDSDLVLIDDLDALAVAIQSIKHSDAYDHDAAEKAMARAVHELNLYTRKKFPNENIPVSVSVYGSARLSRNGIGSMT